MARRWWWVLVLSLVVGAAAGYGVSLLISPTYNARATLLVVQQQNPTVVQLNDLQTSERLANTFTKVVTLRPVLERAISDSGLDLTPGQLEQRLRITNPETTQLLEIQASAGTPEAARDTANAVADAFIAYTSETELAAQTGAVTVLERAEAPGAPVSPRKTLNAVLGGILALIVAAGVILLLEYLDDTVKSAEQILDVSGLPTLGHVEQFSRGKQPMEALQAANKPQSSVAEEYRSTRTNLAYALELAQSGKLLLVTSAGSGEGKTTTVGNLAVVFGLAGHSVAVVDADLRRPMLHRIFGLRNSTGLTNLLLSPDVSLDQALQRSAHPNVSVLTSGPLPPNPSELLGSSRMAEVMDALRERFDIVFVDSPPSLVVTDPTVLATLADAVALVVRAGATRTGALRATVQELAQSGRPIMGAVLNRTRRGDRYYYYGGRKPYYGSRDEEDVEQLPLTPEPYVNGLATNGIAGGPATNGREEEARPGVSHG
jgi:capsular exopolysaccharide synthesis family protein